MKIKKRASSDIPKEIAHGGAGARRVLSSADHSDTAALEMITYGFLPAGGVFDWHNHEGIEEIMIVLSCSGLVHDEDGEYTYAPGDVFIYPPGVMHKVENNSAIEHEMIFVRIRV